MDGIKSSGKVRVWFRTASKPWLSTLADMEELEQWGEAVEGCAVAVLWKGAGLVGLEDVEGEAAEGRMYTAPYTVPT